MKQPIVSSQTFWSRVSTFGFGRYPYLGLTTANDLSWSKKIDKTTKKPAQCLTL